MPFDVAAIAAMFDQVAPSYDAVGVAFFGPVADGLVQVLSPRPGERAADLGCGRGAVLLSLAKAVAPATVAGLDVSPVMLEFAADAAAAEGVRNIALRLADVTDPGLPAESFDVLAASLVLFFLPDPAAALRAWLDVLVPGGRLGVATIGGADPRWQSVDEVFEPWLPADLLDARTAGAAGPFASDTGLESLLSDAGYDEVSTHGQVLPVVFSGADQWHAFSMSVGQRAIWQAVPAAERDRVRGQAYARLAELAEPDGTIAFTQAVRYSLGFKPAPPEV
ncbi:MAG: class I SAM-dependent methyltransferase [Nocardioidaceae bacterium]